MPSILVGSGDRDIRRTLRQSLESDGLTVFEARDDAECRAIVERETLDALVIDSRLDQGHTLAASVRAAYPDLPMVMLVSDETAAESAFANGATDILTQPLNPTVLRYRLRHLLDAALRHRDDWHQSVVENTAEGIFRSTPEGRFLYVNQGMARLLGYDRIEDVLALDIPTDVFFHPEIRRQIQADSDSSDDMLRYEVVLKTRSGDPLPVNVSSRAQRDADGRIHYYDGIMFDLREKKLAESALYQFSEELQAKTQSLQTINAIADLVYDALDVQTVVECALDALLAYFKVSGATLQVVDESGESLTRVSGRELSPIADQLTQSFSMQKTLSGEAVATRELIVSDDLPHETRLNPQLRDDLIAGEITRLVVVPLLAQGNAIGTLTLPLHNGRMLTDQERETLAAAGKTVGLAIANARYIQRIEAEVQERQRVEFAEHQQRVLAEALRDTAAALNSDLDQDRVLDQILTQTQRVIPSNTLNVMLVKDGVAAIVGGLGYGAFGVATETLYALRFPVQMTANLRWMVESGRALAIPDVSTFVGWVTTETSWWVGSHVCAPIKVDGQVIGFLNVDSAEPFAFEPQHARALEIFADQAGIAIRNARLYDAARRYASQLEDVVRERTAEVEQQRAQLQVILDSIGDGLTGVIFTEPLTLENAETITERYRYINQALYDMIGYSSEEWHHKLLGSDQLTPQEYMTFLRQLWEELITKGKWKGEQIIRRKDGTEFLSSAVSTVVRGFDGSIIGAVTIFRDISQEKALEAQKARFISNAAHELRTPITNLKTRLYLARKQPERMDTHLQIMEQVTDHMINLVEHLLDLSRIERGVVELRQENLDLGQFVTHLVVIQLPEAEKKDLTLALEAALEPLIVYADPGRITQVVSNLIANAITYTPTGGSISVRLARGLGEEAGFAVIEVADTGIGIPAEYLPNIFQPFYQATYNMSGVGLGLSISKEIIDLHGGHIQVESQVGQGTCFRIALRLAETLQPA